MSPEDRVNLANMGLCVASINERLELLYNRFEQMRHQNLEKRLDAQECALREQRRDIKALHQHIIQLEKQMKRQVPKTTYVVDLGDNNE